MYSITDAAQGCNIISSQTTDHTAFKASILPKDVSFRSGEEDEEAKLREADKCNAKTHYLSRSVAREHGIIPAAVLAGFACKLKFHKLNQWNDRWWYYDSIETLRTHRWPYLSDGCLCETTDYLQENRLLSKDCNNALSFDRTSWYAMDDVMRAAALSDLVWYDVPVTRKLGSIPAGLIYHNLRFHLREMMEQDPECQVPYHKLNKAMLARSLPMSESTVKRWVKALLDARIIVRHPKKRNLFTIADESEYREIRSDVNAIGSSVNANRSDMNGSKVNANRSDVNANRSKMNANRSKMNDNTQYETSKKPMINHSEERGCVSPEFSSVAKGTTPCDGLADASFVDQQLISDAVGSFPLRGGEETDTVTVSPYPTKLPTTFDQLIRQTAISVAILQAADDNARFFIKDNFTDLCTYFVEQHLDTKDIYDLWGNNNRDMLTNRLNQSFADYIAAEVPGWSASPIPTEQLWQLLYYPYLETMVRSFAMDEVWFGKQTHTMDGQRRAISDTHWALVTKLFQEVSFPPEVKCELLLTIIPLLNKHGWLLSDNSRKINAVQPVSSAIPMLQELFTLNPELTAWQLYSLLDSCVDVSCTEDEPAKGKSDPYWHVRRVKDLRTFAVWLEPIIKELDMFDECPIYNFPRKGKTNP